MKRFLLVLAALGSLYLLAWVGVTLLVKKAEDERAAQDRAVVALGQKLAPELDGLLGADPLAEACRGKLAPGGPHSIALYTVPLEPAFRPSADGKRVDGVLAAWGGTYVNVDPADPLKPPPDFLELLARMASPDEWARRLEHKDALHAETAELRYVAVAQFSSLTPASVPVLGDGDTFDPGTADYKVKVVGFPGGAAVCEGQGRGRMVQKVVGHGRARDSFDAKRVARQDLERELVDRWVQATIGSPLEDLCAVGGEKLCFSAGLMTDGPSW